MTPEQKEKLSADIHRLVLRLDIRVLAHGYIRYEKLRLLTPQRFAELIRKNQTGHGHFDDLVDQLEEPK